MTPEPDPRVTLRHMRMAGVCASGGRDWFRRSGLSWELFVREGLPASVIEATGDGIALSVVAQARQEAAAAAMESPPAAEPAPAAAALPLPPEVAEEIERVRWAAIHAVKMAEDRNRGR